MSRWLWKIAFQILWGHTKRPVSGEHVGEVGDDVEGGVHDVRDAEVDNEVVGDRPHPGVRHHYPYHWKH